MRILVLGGDGMLGHQLLRQLAPRHDVHVTLRNDLEVYTSYGIFGSNSFARIDVRSLSQVAACAKACRPEVIVNAVGIVKQQPNAEDCTEALRINALFPRQLAFVAREISARLIHFSTDCVFSGVKGNYTETDFPDAKDLYGQTKLLGETQEPHTLTLRTSIIGRELSRKRSLVEWFLAQRATVKGFRRAIYTGFTTIEIARIVERVINVHPQASGVWHVSSDPISKYELLRLLRSHFMLETEIVPDDTFVCDRSLASERFRSAFGYTPPSWNTMVQELAADNAFYLPR